LVSSMIINNIFIFPFVLTVMGDQAFTELVIFDIGNAFMTITLTYIVAFSHGPEHTSLRNIGINALKLPAVWALIVAITLNLNSIHLPKLAMDVLDPVGLLTTPLILVALGIYFTPRIKKIRLVTITILVRMLAGFFFGLVFANVFDLQGSTFIIVILCSAAPIGFNAVTYASLAKLDMELAASAVSFSVLIGMITSPLLLYFLQIYIKNASA
ncbi:MAG: putative permease, partial [Planctomycetota bacterium]